MTPVSELLAVKIELATLKIQQVIAIHGELVKQQAALVEEARAEASAPAGHLYNADTRRFQPPPSGPVPLSTSAARQAKRAKP